MQATTLSTSFFLQLTQKRLFAAEIARLAVTMAEQAGESVTRPLSREQLQRAVVANYEEATQVMDLILEWATVQHKDGKIPDTDVFYP